MIEISRQRVSAAETLASNGAENYPWGINPTAAPASRSAARPELAPKRRELPDVTGFLVVVIVTLGLFVVPVGATIMQGPAIVASLFGR